MTCAKIFDTIDDLNDSYIRVWEQVCSIESPSRYKEGVDAVGKFFANMAEQRGWQVEVCPQERSGDVVCITMNPDAQGKPISLSGHTDTVFAVGTFGDPVVRRDDKKIYGPGVTDCKGGIVAAFLAMDALRQCGFTDRPVRLLLQSDEEVGSMPSKKATIGYICEKAKDSVAFLNLEGHTGNSCCLKRKGIVTFTFTVNGIEAHSSNCATAGANAIAEAAYKIIELEKIKDNDGLTCNCGLIRGGSVVNTVPGFCEFKANVRYATAEQYDEICKRVEEIAAETHVEGCTCEVSISGYRIAMELKQQNVDLLARMNEIFVSHGLAPLEGASRKGGSDAADVTAYGIPCVDSLGVRGGKIHSSDEYGQLDSLAECAKRYASVIVSL